MYFRTPQPLFHIADEQGCVSDQGLEQAGVSLDHKDEIQAAIDVAWKRILASMKERVQPDARNSDAEKGIRAYLIPAQMGLREEILGKLESDFTRICGAEQGSLLLRGLHPGGHFGYFGRQSLMVRIVPKADGEGKQAEYSAFDPVSGNQILSGTETNPDRFRALFGNAIEW